MKAGEKLLFDTGDEFEVVSVDGDGTPTMLKCIRPSGSTEFREGYIRGWGPPYQKWEII